MKKKNKEMTIIQTNQVILHIIKLPFLTIKFKNNHFEKTNQLVEFISQYKYDLKLRSDQTLVYNYQKTSNKDRIYKAFSFAKELQAL